MIVSFVDIGGIVDNYNLIFIFIILTSTYGLHKNSSRP